MNLRLQTLALLLSPPTSYSLPHKTNEPATITGNSNQPRRFIRGLSDNGAEFIEETDSNDNDNDNAPNQMQRLFTSMIDGDSHREEDTSVNVVDYLSRPNNVESLAKSINNKVITSYIYNDDVYEDQDRQDVAHVLNESVELASFFGVSDAKAFPVFSYDYDTMPPTISIQTEIINESLESLPKVPTPVPTSSTAAPSTSENNADDDLLETNESNEISISRPQEQILVQNASDPSRLQVDEIVHSPSLSPSFSVNAATDKIETTICFPPCKETDEICRSGGKGGLGMCHSKCKSKKRCDYGHVCRSDGYCDRCRACKSFKKKECCSIDLEICREVLPEEKIDKCFGKCSYNEDCNMITPNSDDICLLDGGCSKTKSKKKNDDVNYKKAQKYYTSAMETKYVAKEDKYQQYGQGKHGNKGLRFLRKDIEHYPAHMGRGKTIQKESSKSHRTMRRRRLYSQGIPA